MSTATPTALRITTPARTITAGSCSLPITVRRLNSAGSATAPSFATLVNLAQSGWITFYSDSLCKTKITSKSIPAYQSDATFYFSAIVATSSTITASSSGLTSARQTEVIKNTTAARVTFVVGPSGTKASGTTITPALDIRIQDTYWNVVEQSTAPITVSIAAGSASGQLSGTLVKNAVAGRTLFDNVKVFTSTGGSFKLVASSPGLISGTSGSFWVNAGTMPSPTPTPTATVSPTPTPTATVSPTPTPTATVSPTPTPTATVSPTPTPTATVSPSPTPTATPPAGSPIIGASTEGIEKPTPERNFVLNTAPQLSLSLARNEITGRVLRASVTSCQTVAVNAPSGVTVSLFRMPRVTTTTPSFNGAIVGQHYDPLVPLSTANGQVCPTDTYIWADIQVASTVAPGSYTMSIGGLPVTLKVLNFTIPARPTMPLYIGLSSYELLLAHGLPSSSGVDVQGALALKYVNLLRSHRIEPDGQLIVNPPVKADGSLDIDQYSAYGGSFRQLVMNGAIAPVNTISPSYIGSPWASAQTLQGWQRTLGLEPGLAGAWAYITDEPSDIAGTAARAQLVRQNAPSMKIMVTHEPTTQLLGLVDNFVVLFDDFKTTGHWMDYSQAPNYWVYGSCVSHGSCANGSVGNLYGSPDLMLDQPDVHGRAYPLVGYALGAKAEIYYSSMVSYGQLDPWTNQYLFGGNGDGTLLYPGVKGQRGFTDNVPVASIRLKAIRQGMYDIEYVAAAKRAGISTNFGTVVPSQFGWSRSNAAYENLRAQIATALGY